jgi:hypothetical protein
MLDIRHVSGFGVIRPHEVASLFIGLPLDRFARGTIHFLIFD